MRGPPAELARLRPAAGGSLRGLGQAPDGADRSRGARLAGPRGLSGARTPGTTSRSAGGGSLLPLAAGPRAPFPPPAGPRGARREGARPGLGGGGTGATQALPDEWAGGARPGRMRAPPARPAKRSGSRPDVRADAPGSPAEPWAAGEGACGRRLRWGRLGML